MRSRSTFAAALATLLLFLTGCASTTSTPTPPAPLPVDGVLIVGAAPEKGFHYPYILRIPKTADASRLLVEPNNTGKVADDFSVHEQAALDLSRRAVGAFVATKLRIPLLVPIFPRREKEWQIYTHMLDRDVMSLQDGPLRRLDLQLLAMIDDAQSRLHAFGRPVAKKVLLTGFSASGTFANRFTLMHPERVHAVATGGLNGLLMIPAPTLDSVALPYPLGTSDFEAVTGSRFDESAWRRVPQFIYMGAKDDNDAVQFDDGYSADEKALVVRILGEKMQPDRWQRVQELYRQAGANAMFRTYAHMGHGTDRTINEEITEFFRAAMSASDE